MTTTGQVFKKILACSVSRNVIVIALDLAVSERPARPMFIKLSYSYDDRKLFCEPASTC